MPKISLLLPIVAAIACRPPNPAECVEAPTALLQIISGGDRVETITVLSAEGSTDPCEAMTTTWSFTEKPNDSALHDGQFAGSGSTEAFRQTIAFDVGGTYGVQIDVENEFGLDSDDITFTLTEGR